MIHYERCNIFIRVDSTTNVHRMSELYALNQNNYLKRSIIVMSVISFVENESFT